MEEEHWREEVEECGEEEENRRGEGRRRRKAKMKRRRKAREYERREWDGGSEGGGSFERGREGGTYSISKADTEKIIRLL